MRRKIFRKTDKAPLLVQDSIKSQPRLGESKHDAGWRLERKGVKVEKRL